MATESQERIWEIVRGWDVDTYLRAKEMFAPIEEEEEQMSDPVATIDTMTKCYQCEEELTVDPVDEVHPLCEDCQNEFDDWLQFEMMKLG